MKKYQEFIYEKININHFAQEYNFITPEIESFWSRLGEKLEDEEFEKINNRNSQDVFEFNEKARSERKTKRDERKKTTENPPKKPTVEKQPEITDRKLQFSRDSSDQLLSKLNKREYKSYAGDIKKILHDRTIKKQKQEQKQKQKDDYHQKHKQPVVVEKRKTI